MTHDRADVAAAEGIALALLLRQLDDADWDRPTDCPEWTVRDMTAHLVGQAEGTRRPWVVLRRQRTGARHHPGRTPLDAYTAQQIEEHEGESGPAFADAFADVWPRAVMAMRRTPGLVRRVSIATGICRPAADDGRLLLRQHPAARPVDAPGRPVPGHRPRAQRPGARRRHRRRRDRRPRPRLGRPARAAGADRPRRRRVVARRGPAGGDGGGRPGRLPAHARRSPA